MKVLFFEPYATATPHFETALELIQDHLNNNDDVQLLHCDADLNSCEANQQHLLSVCAQCITRRGNGIRTIQGRERIRSSNFIELSGKEKHLINNWNVSFNTITELKSYQYDGMDLGMAIASSLISFHRNPEPDMAKSAYLIRRMFKAALKVYYSFRRRLQEDRPEVVYIFNGRFSNIRPVIRLCELNRIEYRIHERGANRNKYSLFKNHLPHDFDKFRDLVEENWDRADISDREKIAASFFEDRKAGKEQGWHSFVAFQKKNELPEGWDSSKRNIVIFNSSEDEFAAIADSVKKRLFKTQLEGMKFISKLVEGHPEVSVYVRIHPNLTNVNNSTVTGIYDLTSANFHTIPPTSTVSTYELIDSADLIVTFGSTVGIEATFWDKPSILLGDSFYKDLGVTYNPDTAEELTQLLYAEKKPKDKLGAYKYGYYLNTYGFDFNYYKAEGLFKGEFKGEKIKPSPWVRRYLKRKAFSPLIKFISRIHAERF